MADKRYEEAAKRHKALVSLLPHNGFTPAEVIAPDGHVSLAYVGPNSCRKEKGTRTWNDIPLRVHRLLETMEGAGWEQVPSLQERHIGMMVRFVALAREVTVSGRLKSIEGGWAVLGEAFPINLEWTGDWSVLIEPNTPEREVLVDLVNYAVRGGHPNRHPGPMGDLEGFLRERGYTLVETIDPQASSGVSLSHPGRTGEEE